MRRRPSTPSSTACSSATDASTCSSTTPAAAFLSPAEAITPKGFRTVIDLNVQGTWLMTHAAATKAFIPQGGGKVLSVTLSPHNGMPGMVHSGAARAAVENMMRTLATEWARFGIKTCALAAGQFKTETLMTKYPQVVVDNLERSIPIGRAGRAGGDGLAGRLPRLAGRRLLLRDDDHDRRRPRQLGRPLAARGDRRRVRRPRSPRSAGRRTENPMRTFAMRCVANVDGMRRGRLARLEDDQGDFAALAARLVVGVAVVRLRAPPARAARAPPRSAARAWTGAVLASRPGPSVSGLAIRLWYQAGCLGKPPLEATIDEVLAVA